MLCPPQQAVGPMQSTSKPGLLSYLTGWKSGSGFGSATEVDEVVGKYGAHGKVIFVTGATSPIARALCISLFRHGATVVLGFQGPPNRGEELVVEIQEAVHQSQSAQPNQPAQAAQEAPPIPTPSGVNSALQSPAGSDQTAQAAAPAYCASSQSTAFPDADGAVSRTSNEAVGQSMGKLLHVPCDFSSLEGAKACADAFEALGLPLHILINCVSTICTSFKLTTDNLEEHFGVNHLAPFLLTARLLPLLVASTSPTANHAGKSSSPQQTLSPSKSGGSDSQDPPTQHVMPPNSEGFKGVARVVWVSCSAHYITYLPSRGAGRHAARWPVQGQGAGYGYLSPQAYGLSKAAAILGSREMARRAAAAGLPLASFSVHPGVTSDGLKRYGGYGTDSIAHKMKAFLADGMSAVKALKSHSQAAASIAYAALAPELVAPASSVPPVPSSHAQQTSYLKQPLTSTPASGAAPSLKHPAVELTTPVTTQRTAKKDQGVDAASLYQGLTAHSAASEASLRERGSETATHAGTSAASGATTACESPSAETLPENIQVPGRPPLHAYLEDCNISKPSPAASDDELACTLWEFSEALAARFMSDTHYLPLMYPRGL